MFSSPEAACLQHDPELWFNERGNGAVHAVRICTTECPVQRECLTITLDIESVEGVGHGILGGLTATERRKSLRRIKTNRQKNKETA